MNHILLVQFMAVLILACVFMGVVVFASQRQGRPYMASVDKAFAWGSCVLVMGCCLNIVAYMA